MSSSKVPFYAQAAILDRYIHSSDPNADPDTLEVLLEMLRSRQDLRDYFFRGGPNAAWAAVLWDHGFFDDPPSPQKTEAGYVLPRWDVQEYLISVASQVPDIVIKHIESVHGQGWYIAQAIQAVCFVPAEEAGQAVPKIIEWLEDPLIADAIARQTYELMVRLAQKSQTTSALSLFRALTSPVPSSDVKKVDSFTWGGEAISKFRRAWNEDQVLSSGLELLKELDIQGVIAILEEHLCNAIHLEAVATNSPGFEVSSWWRTAIEDTGQDSDHHYRDKLLGALRDALETWVQRDAAAVEPLLRRYLSQEREILRRLGLHLLHRFPTEYRRYVAQELRKTENLDDVGIHHEFFMLLQQGYLYLEAPDQEVLVAAICSGPPPERAEKLAKWAQEERSADPDEYIQYHSKAWIRDRLWMLKDYLTDHPAQVLNELVAELGIPEHPAFTSWSTGPYWVRDVSPITDQEISRMSPGELASFLEQWQPGPDQKPAPERISYKGLANVVATVIVANLEKYADQLIPIARHRPELAYAVLDKFREGEAVKSVPWDLSIDLCEQLLADENVRHDMSRAFEGNWVSVRQSVVQLLQIGLGNPERAIPAEYLPRVRDILLTLVDDPDPEPTDDQPPQGWFGHGDPATVAINHVRPNALIALVEYARFCALLAGESARNVALEGPGPERLETIVREALTRKLDRHEDPSWAAHSVYGRCLPLLYWLDQEWVKSHLNQIFPEEEDEQSTRFYVAAWDSFVIFNGFYLSMLGMLRAKYERAIYNLSRGYVTQTHLEPVKGLAAHLVWEYLRSDYDLRSLGGQKSLIATFFKQAPPEARGNAVWILWRVCKENPADLEIYWPKARSLWEWRVHEASIAGHSPEFDEEMQWFGHLLDVAPKRETITSLWPLLEGLLPHITRSEHRDYGWDLVEEYLSREVEHDPVRVIQFYRLMYDQRTGPKWFSSGEQTRKIIETAAACRDSRHEALSLIDLIARSGDHRYRDIYERFAG